MKYFQKIVLIAFISVIVFSFTSAKETDPLELPGTAEIMQAHRDTLPVYFGACIGMPIMCLTGIPTGISTIYTEWDVGLYRSCVELWDSYTHKILALEFSVSSIPDDATIDDVSLVLHCTDLYTNIPGISPPFNIKSYDMLERRPSTELPELSYGDATQGTTYFAGASIDSGSYGYHLNATAVRHLKSQLADNWFALGINLDEAVTGDTDTSYVSFTNTETEHYLIINWHIPVDVRVQTNFSRGTLMVNGVPRPTPFDTTMIPEALIQISVDSVQTFPPGVRFLFRNWTDGEARQHWFMPISDTTVTANFDSVYRLEIISEYGTTAGSGWYIPLTAHMFSVTPDTVIIGGVRHVFQRWVGTGSGSYTGPNDTAMATMNAPITEVAVWDTSYWLTLEDSGCGGGIPLQTEEGWYEKDTWATISTSDSVWNLDGGYWVYFDHWEGGTFDDPYNRVTQVLMETTTTATAYYYPPLIIDVYPAALTEGPPLTIVNIPVVFDCTQPLLIDSFALTINYDATLLQTMGVTPAEIPWDSIISVDLTVGDTGKVRAYGGSDTGIVVTPIDTLFYFVFLVPLGGAGECDIRFDDFMYDIAEARTEDGIFRVLTSAINIMVNTSFDPGTVWVDLSEYPSAYIDVWTSGEFHNIGVDSMFYPAPGQIFNFREWSDGGAIFHDVAPIDDSVFTAEFDTLFSLTVESEYGVPAGSGWYVIHNLTPFSVTPETVAIVDSHRVVFTEWTGTGTVSYTGSNNPAQCVMESPIVEIAEWDTQYYITVDYLGSGAVEPMQFGEGWHLDDSWVNLETEDSIFGGGTWYYFQWWIGGIFTDIYAPNTQILADTARTAIAVYSNEPGIFEVNPPDTVFGEPTDIVAIPAIFRASGPFDMDSVIFDFLFDANILTFMRMSEGTVPWDTILGIDFSVDATGQVTGMAFNFTSPNVVMPGDTLFNFICRVDLGAGGESPLHFDNFLCDVALAGTNDGVFIVTGEVEVTVGLDFPGGRVRVDGTYYTAPYIRDWLRGSIHTIAVDSVQMGTPGTRYLYLSWSDFRARIHDVSAIHDTVFTAFFTKQYELTLESPYGVTGGAGWFDEGDTALFVVLPETLRTPNEEHYFQAWNGTGDSSYTGPNNPARCALFSPIRELALWESIYNLRLAFTGCGGGVPTQTGAGWYPEGTWAAITTDSMVIDGPDTFYFHYWEGGVFNDMYSYSTEVLVNGVIVATAVYGEFPAYFIVYPKDTTYGASGSFVSIPVFLTTDEPLEVDSIGFDILFDTDIIQYSSVLNGHIDWDLIQGTDMSAPPLGEARIFAKSSTIVTLDDGDILCYVVFYVSGDTGRTAINLDDFVFGLAGAITRDGVFIIGDRINVLISTDIPGGSQVIVDGTTYPSPHLESWVRGSEHLIAVDQIQPHSPDTQYVFAAWSDARGRAHYVRAISDTFFLARYRPRFFLHVDNGGHGTAYGEGWYIQGAAPDFWVEPETLTIGEVRYVFRRWIGIGDGSYTGTDNPANCVMNSTIIERANWFMQYYLTLDYEGCGAAVPAQTGMGWYNSGSWTNISTDNIVFDGPNRYHFTHWSGASFTDSSAWNTQAFVDTTRIAIAHYSAFEVSPPESMFAATDDIILIPAIFYNNAPMFIDSSGISFRFNNTLITFLGMVRADADWDTIYGEDLSTGPFGLVVAEAFSAATHEFEPFDTLFFFMFQVGAGGGTSNLVFDNFSFDLETAYTWHGVLIVTPPVHVQVVSDVGGPVYVDGVEYPSPYDSFWAFASPHEIAVDLTLPFLGDTIRHIFDHWSDGRSRVHLARAVRETVFTAYYVLQYRLRVVSPLGTTAGSGWYYLGDSVTISVDPDSIIMGDTLMYLFNMWVGRGDSSYNGTLNPAIAVVYAPIVEIANWNRFYYLQVDNGGYGTPTGEGWHLAGSTPAFSVDPDTILLDGTHRVVFSDWTGRGTGSYTGTNNPANCTMNGPIQELAHWVHQYYLTVLNGGRGTVFGEGWYDYDDSARFYITPTVIDSIAGIRYFFSGWTGTGDSAYSGPESLNYCHIYGPCVEQAHWVRQYYLTVVTDHSTPFGEGWYNAGAVANFGVDPDTEMIGDGSRYKHIYWTGVGPGSYTGSENPEACIMNGPITETATWEHQFYLEMDDSGCGSAGPAQTGEGWHPASEWTAITTEDIVYDGWVRYHFTHWIIDGGGAVEDDTLNETNAFMDTTHRVVARYSSFEVSPPETSYVLAGDTICIPVVLYSNMSRFILSVGIDFDYPNDLLTYIGVVPHPGGIPWSYIVGAQFDPNTIRIYGTQSGTWIDPPETLFCVKFYVHCDSANTDSVRCHDLSYDIAGADTRPGVIIIQGSVDVTIKVSFDVPDAMVRVDGTWWESPHTATWLSGTYHNIYAALVYTIDEQSRWIWDSWSDGGARGHNIVPVEDDTITALYLIQYRLTVLSSHGTPSGQGWYYAGAPATFRVSPDTILDGGARYIYQSWTGTGAGSYTGPNNPWSVTMNNPITEHANWQTQYYLTVFNGGRGTVTGEGWYNAGTGATFEVTPTLIESTATIRYIFDHWNGTGPGSYDGPANPGNCTMNGAIIERVIWQRQYYLTVENGGHGVTSGTGWYDEDEVAGFDITPGIIDSTADIRFVFDRWAGIGIGSYTGHDNPAECVMESPIVETASWLVQYYLDVVSDWGSISGNGWYFAGAIVHFSVTPETITVGGTRRIFIEWDGTGDAAYSGTDNPASCTVNSPIIEEAIWQTQYYLTVDNGGHGTPSGEGWYNAGVVAVFSVFPEVIEIADSTRVFFRRWTGVGPGSYSGVDNPAGCAMHGPITETAVWRTQYYLTVNSIHGITSGEGWYNDGTVAHFSVTPETVVAGTLRSVFDSWNGIGLGSYTGPDNPGACAMNEPISEDAAWTEEIYLELTYRGCGAAIPTQTGEGWYAISTLADISTQDVIYDGPIRYAFAYWSDGTFGDPTLSSTTVAVDSPMTIIASYSPFEASPPDTIWGLPDDTIEIPVVLYNDGVIDIDSIGLTFYFDEALLTFAGLVEHTLDWDAWFTWSVGAFYRALSPDENISLQAYNDATVFNITPPETLIFIQMIVNTGAVGSCPFYFRAFELDLSEAQTVDGVFIVNTNISVRVENDFGGDSVIVDGVKYASPYDTDWIPGSEHDIEVDQVIGAGAGTRYNFTHWSDGGSRAHTVSPIDNVTYTAHFQLQHLLGIFNPMGFDSPIPPVGSHWYDDGALIEAYVNSPDTNYHAYCTGYNGIGSAAPAGDTTFVAFNITQPSVIEWLWVSMVELLVESEYGSPEPPVSTTWYIPGATIDAHVDSAALLGDGIRVNCTGWTGTGAAPAAGDSNHFSFIIDENSTIDWEWDIQYHLTLDYTGTGGAPVTQVGEGWYTPDDLASIETESPVILSGTHYFFQHWYSIPPGANFTDSTQRNTDVEVDTPLTAVAFYRRGIEIVIYKEPREDYGAIFIGATGFLNRDSIATWRKYGSVQNISVSDPDIAEDTMFAFTHWSDGGLNPHLVGPLNRDTTFIAYYDKFYKCVISKDPLTDVYGWMDIGEAHYTGAASSTQDKWFKADSSYDIGVSGIDDITPTERRFVFNSWSDGGAIAHNTGRILGPIDFTAYYDRQYACTVQKDPLQTYGDITIDGTTFEYTAQEDFWAYEDSTYTLTVSDPDAAGDTIFNFANWNEGGDIDPTHITLPVDTMETYIAYYDTEMISVDITALPGNWRLGIVGLNETKTMPDREVIILTVRSTYNTNLGLKITDPGAFWVPGYTQADDRFVLRAKFNDSPTAPPAFSPSLDVLRSTLTWATTDIFGPGGINIPTGTSENLWLQFIAPTLSSTYLEQTITIEVWGQVDLP
ncbi:hypothetical protein JXI42_14580 [bacterium]|nr:hypothetical protein [bacterium]